MSESKPGKKSVHIGQEVYEEASKEAKRTGIPLTQFVNNAVALEIMRRRHERKQNQER